MGGSSSKVAQGAQAAKRKLPTTVTSSSTLNQRSPIPPTSTASPSTKASAPPPSSSNNQPPPQSRPTPGPTVHPSPSTPSSQPSSTRTQFIDLDARDPTFSSNLRSIGPVQPVPTGSNSSTFSPEPAKPTTYQSESHPASHGSSGPTGRIFPDARMNPALLALRARDAVAKRAEDEMQGMGRKGFQGRTVVDAGTLGQVVRAREGAKGDEEVEARWRLKRGVLQEKLGERGKVWGSLS